MRYVALLAVLGALALPGAAKLGLHRVLRLGLFLAATLLKGPLPAGVAPAVLADQHVQALGRQVEQLLFDPPRKLDLVAQFRFHAQARERWRDRVRFGIATATMLSPSDLAMAKLPARLSGLYYLLRGARLMSTHLVSPIVVRARRGR